MNWTTFLLWLGAIYALYYTAIILFESLNHKDPAATKTAAHELTFSEPVVPLNAVELFGGNTAPSSPISQGPKLSAPEMIASGGVLLKDVFSLARKEAIVYLKEVSF
ncbi:hypothetical protein DIU31_009200 [Mucilaginibacter rubeus]|uniref:Uncharacterized protein n=1 Tax=Mucilaginibacter rubeus TaxID=2027860 RepID=A0AAE6MHK6_9SPHI|nr:MULTISPECIES: hypothetical protein [Mucilaginibacter]QEM03681.1 hypothetical protein DIU31_009200 [Mucilaginibacter rubeus]QEM16292.1 hypothetical protein DIU38_009295 [Mucilaginibacter gossypii]QTE40946.1 hypothetical protein J3L19_18470 [Mucilaginibacter rubeus]QTE47549.1 hypothetical protein J3L21_18445 [Mucilaginibacter rubeus]QTE58941.1 hypothetical protein J3L23_10110 [Mucilaginibacter rubeus]